MNYSSETRDQGQPSRLRSFTLRFLLIFVLVTSVGLSIYIRFERPRAAISKLESQGARLTFSTSEPGTLAAWVQQYAPKYWFESVIEVSFHAGAEKDLGDIAAAVGSLGSVEELYLLNFKVTNKSDWARIGKLQSLQRLSLPEMSLEDSDLKHLSELTNLKELDLSFAKKLTGDGLSHISRLNSLESLNLKCCGMVGDGLGNLSELTELKSLCLRCVWIRGDSLKHLRQMDSLERLNLDSCMVGDKEIKSLPSLNSLKRLHMPWNKVTEEGVLSLDKFKNLEALNIDFVHKGKIAAVAIEELKSKNPGLEVSAKE